MPPTNSQIPGRILFGTLILGSCLLCASSSNAQRPLKRVLLEHVDATWCGWCPRGFYALDSLLKKYPGRLLDVSEHEQDVMTISAVDSLYNGIPGSNIFGANGGFPSGMIDRVSFHSSNEREWNLFADEWIKYFDARMNDSASAEVAISPVAYDSALNTFSFDVTSTFYDAEQGDLRLTVYVVEDSVVGPSPEYDQKNFLAGVASYYPNTYVDQPAVIPGFAHHNVMRVVPSGIWGTPNIIPAKVAAHSSYTEHFSISLGPSVNPDHSLVIAALHRFSAQPKTTDTLANEVLNCASANLSTLPVIAGLTISPVQQYVTVAANDSSAAEMIVTNTNTIQVAARLSVDSSQIQLQSGWSTTFDPLVTLAPGEARHVRIVFHSNDIVAFTRIPLYATPILDGHAGISSSPMWVGALSKNTQYAFLNAPLHLIECMRTDLRSRAAFLPLDPAIMDAYPVNRFEVTGFADVDFLDDGSNDRPTEVRILPYVYSALESGKKVFVSSGTALAYAFEASVDTAYKTNGIRAFFGDSLGLGYTSYSASAKDVAGSDNLDTPPFTFSINALQAHSLADYTATLNTRKLFSYLPDTTSLAGVGYTNGQSRLAMLNFYLRTITDSTKEASVLNATIDWLLGAENGVPSGVFSTEGSITAYPNPSHGGTIIRYHTKESGVGVQFTILDLLGRTVEVLTGNRDLEGVTASIPAHSLVAGVYTVVIHTSSGSRTLRFITE